MTADWIDLEHEQPWCTDVLARMETLSDEALVWMLAGAQSVIRERNRRDVDEEDPTRPWRTIRRHAVAHQVNEPPRLTITWANYEDPATKVLIFAAPSGCEQPVATICMGTKSGRSGRRATLIHELVHWERGVQDLQRAPWGSWEREEEESVVRAIAARRLEAVGESPSVVRGATRR